MNVSFEKIENFIWIGLAWLDLYGICNGTNVIAIIYLKINTWISIYNAFISFILTERNDNICTKIRNHW